MSFVPSYPLESHLIHSCGGNAEAQELIAAINSAGGTLTATPPIFITGNVVSIGMDSDQNFFIGGGGASYIHSPSFKGENISIGGGHDGGYGPGPAALFAITTGHENIAIGAGSGAGLTNAVGNVLIGVSSAAIATDGTSGVFLGEGVAQNATSLGQVNIGIGRGALQSMSSFSATFNLAVGYFSLSSITSGQDNSAIGRAALGGVTSGAFNVGFGLGAGLSVTDGTKNTFLGYFADTDKTSIAGGIAIGDHALVKNDYQCVIGGAAGNSTTGVPIGFGGTTAPADADIVSSQIFLFMNDTPGSGTLRFKGKTSDGNVFSGSVGTTSQSQIVAHLWGGF